MALQSPDYLWIGLACYRCKSQESQESEESQAEPQHEEFSASSTAPSAIEVSPQEILSNLRFAIEVILSSSLNNQYDRVDVIRFDVFRWTSLDCN